MTNLIRIEADLLGTKPLPQPAEGSKEERGRVCIIGGSREVPGAVVLSAHGAMRAGAGKLQIITAESRAAALGIAMPEALVIGLQETSAGGLECRAFVQATSRWTKVDALLLGPGMVEEPDCDAIMEAVLASDGEATIVIDAGALPRLLHQGKSLQKRSGRVIITPHAGEMANLMGVDRETIDQDPMAAAARLTERFGLVVVMKGSRTVVTAPSGAWCYEGGGVGLATSGSGDVLAGIVAGLAARGTEPADAAIWGVFLHGEAGARLATSLGPLGFLAREIPHCVPALMGSFQDRKSAAT